MKILLATFCTLPFKAYVAPGSKNQRFFSPFPVSIFSKFIITGLLPFKLSTSLGPFIEALGFYDHQLESAGSRHRNTSVNGHGFG